MKQAPYCRIVGISLAGFDKDTFTDQVALFDLMKENVKSDKQEKPKKAWAV